MLGGRTCPTAERARAFCRLRTGGVSRGLQRAADGGSVSGQPADWWFPLPFKPGIAAGEMGIEDQGTKVGCKA